MFLSMAPIIICYIRDILQETNWSQLELGLRLGLGLVYQPCQIFLRYVTSENNSDTWTIASN